jgi:hypothetical protein
MFLPTMFLCQQDKLISLAHDAILVRDPGSSYVGSSVMFYSCYV